MEMAGTGEELVGGFLLVVRETLVERPEGGKEALCLLRAHLLETRPRLQALECGLGRIAVAAELLEGLRPLLGVVAHGLRHLVELRRLRVGDLELRLQKGDAAFDMPAWIEAAMLGLLCLRC